MIFRETTLPGAFVVELEKKTDSRGFFSRAFCAREFADHGLNPKVVQANLSYNDARGTIRGMHYQVAPASEPKFIRCIRGAIWDVIIDMRPESPTYLEHFGIELSADNRLALYVPDMFAHGNQALTDGTEMFYLLGEYYTPGYERGVRYDDPAIGIEWPLPATVLSDKDANWPLLNLNSTAAKQPVRHA
jgi:dTDP-4-dehydrorhamnose 3,5-epimerase